MKNKIISVSDVGWEYWSHGDDFGSKQKHVGDTAGAERVGVTMEKLAPGMTSALSHYHTKEEEHIYAIQGEATLYLNGEPHQFSEGNYICFTANSGVAHQFINQSNADFTFLVVGNRDAHDVVVYPETNKVLVRSMNEVYSRRPSSYFDKDED
ncbi:cupin domain-containing protein [Shewanella sp. 10N.286.54.B9]|uniref:cupin domain-containing protein n=1 Tax=Shewanella sp. 10N.286.54.B9 TaxID=3229719 RepID=UPI00354DFF33